MERSGISAGEINGLRLENKSFPNLYYNPIKRRHCWGKPLFPSGTAARPPLKMIHWIISGCFDPKRAVPPRPPSEKSEWGKRANHKPSFTVSIFNQISVLTVMRTKKCEKKRTPNKKR